MTQVIDLKSRGTLTLPKALREQAGLKAGDRLLVEISPQGILLRPVGVYPLEIYADARVKEFLAAAEEVESYGFR